MSRPRFLFDCARKWHTPIEGTPDEIVQFGDGQYSGHICSKCGSVYYERVKVGNA